MSQPQHVESTRTKLTTGDFQKKITWWQIFPFHSTVQESFAHLVLKRGVKSHNPNAEALQPKTLNSSKAWSQASGFLKLRATDIWGWSFLCCIEGSCPMHQRMLRGIPGLYPPDALAPLHTQSYDKSQKCLQRLPGEEGRTIPMLRTVGLGKGGAGRTQLRVDTLRAQTDEWATCAPGPRVGLGCWLSNRKPWQEWEEPGSGRS